MLIRLWDCLSCVLKHLSWHPTFLVPSYLDLFFSFINHQFTLKALKQLFLRLSFVTEELWSYWSFRFCSAWSYWRLEPVPHPFLCPRFGWKYQETPFSDGCQTYPSITFLVLQRAKLNLRGNCSSPTSPDKVEESLDGCTQVPSLTHRDLHDSLSSVSMSHGVWTTSWETGDDFQWSETFEYHQRQKSSHPSLKPQRPHLCASDVSRGPGIQVFSLTFVLLASWLA